jgi:hypothetical protein
MEQKIRDERIALEKLNCEKYMHDIYLLRQHKQNEFQSK